MGSGKTTLGKKVSKSMEMEFFDLDHMIEQELKASCFDIIEKFGIEYFRRLENQKLAYLATLDRTFISLGGGTLIAEQNLKQILIKGLLVYLRWTPEGLLKNIQSSETRPLLKKIEMKGLLRLLKERSEGYAQAHIVIDCDGKTKLQVAKEIEDELRKLI